MDKLKKGFIWFVAICIAIFVILQVAGWWLTGVVEQAF